MSGLKKAGKILILLLLAMLILLTVFVICSRLFFSSNSVSVFGWRSMAVLSSSMEPTFFAGDLIVANERPADDYRVGDIVTFEDDQGNSITHRILSRQGDTIITKGDFEGNSPDRPISVQKVKAKFVFSIPIIGRVLQFLHQPFGMLLLAIAGAILIAGDYLLSRR